MDPVTLVLLVMLVASGLALLTVIFFWVSVDSDRRQPKEPRSSRTLTTVAPGGTTSDSGVDSTSMWIATNFGGVSTGSHHCSGSSWDGGDCGGSSWDGGGCD